MPNGPADAVPLDLLESEWPRLVTALSYLGIDADGTALDVLRDRYRHGEPVTLGALKHLAHVIDQILLDAGPAKGHRL